MRFLITVSMIAVAAASPLALHKALLDHRPAVENLYRRQNSTGGPEGFTCGSDKYTADQIQAAGDAACNYIKDGETAGDSKYPEQMDNREGFEWPVTGQLWEFPIMDDGEVYNGGQPGPDRLVLNENCDIAGGVTHTGAEGNAFLQCGAKLNFVAKRNSSSPL